MYNKVDNYYFTKIQHQCLKQITLSGNAESENSLLQFL